MWSEWDEGMARAIDLDTWLRRGESIADVNCSVALAQNEHLLATMQFSREIFIDKSVQPHSYFRLRPKWDDPAKAIALMPITLSVNLTSRAIAKARNTQKAFWATEFSGILFLTNLRLLFRVESSDTASDWEFIDFPDLADAALAPDGLHLRDKYSRDYRLQVRPLFQAWLFVAVRFLAFGERGIGLPVPDGFAQRARENNRPLDGREADRASNAALRNNLNS